MIYVITEIDDSCMWIMTFASRWFDRFNKIDVQLLNLFDQGDAVICRDLFDTITCGQCINLREIHHLKWRNDLIDRDEPRRFVTLTYA